MSRWSGLGMWSRRGRTPIGLDLGAAAVKAVQLAGAGEPRVEAAFAMPRPAGVGAAELVEIVAGALERGGFAGREVVVAAPTLAQTIVPLQLPPAQSPAPRDQIALAQAADAARVDGAELQLAWWETPSRPGGGATGLGVAVPTRDVLALVEPFEAAGFEVVAVDALATALARAAEPWLSDAGPTAVMDAGHSALSIVTIRGGVVVYQRTLKELGLAGVLDRLEAITGPGSLARRALGRLAAGEGARDGRWAAARAVVSAWMDDVARETAASLAYAGTPDGPVPAVLLTGGGADVPGVAEALAARLPESPPGRLTLGERLGAAGVDEALRSGSGGLLALGLALHGAGGVAASGRAAA